MKQLIKHHRSYSDRISEKNFVREILSRKMTPEIERQLKLNSVLAQKAMTAPFLDKFRKAENFVA